MIINLLFVCLSTFILLYLTITRVKSEFLWLFLIAFAVRIVVLLIDYYHIILLPNSDADSEVFNELALENLNRNSNTRISFTGYVTFLTIIYSLFDASRFIGQYINVLFSYFAMLIIYKTVNLLTSEKKIIRNIMLIWALLPNVIILSAILLREAWCHFFIAMSLYYFVSWLKYGKIKNVIWSIIPVLVATWMHGGCIGLAIGYMLAFLTYDRRNNKIKLSSNTFILLPFIIIVSFIYLNNLEIFGEKFTGLAEEDNIFDSQKVWDEGGSDYLVSIKDASIGMRLILSPLLVFYLLFSPLPWNWRGIQDVAVFVTESIVLFKLCYDLVKKHSAQTCKYLKRYLVLSFLIISIIFAMGTSNTGTGMRHRVKCLPALLVAAAVPYKRY